MNISEQLETIREAIAEWAEPLGGKTYPVSNLKELWSQASLSSQKPSIFICYMGEKIRGPFGAAAIMGRVDRQWTVAVTRGRGFAANRGDTLTQTVGNADPFPDQVEEVRDIIRSLEGINMEGPIDYKGIKPMQLGNLVVDGYLIEFSTDNDLPVLETKGT